MRYWDRHGVVIGVAEDIRDEEMRNSTALSFYAARRQAQQLGGSIVIRTTVAPQSLVASIRQRVREIQPDIAIISARPLTDLIRDQLAAERYRARLVIVFSVMAGLFALMGIYGVTARSVAARTRELGIRKAFGAPRTGILGLVLGQALRLALAGAVLGVVVSFIATRAIEAYLWGVSRTDPVTLVGIAALLGVASIVAALAPARRAARIDPIEALRAE
jgi:ABC-type antimicrobial peptide transport system permease subunit